MLNDFGEGNERKAAKPVDVEAQMKRKINRSRKELQERLHRAELLSWIGHGNFVNTRLNDMDLIKNALKLLPKNQNQCYPKDKTDIDYFKQITAWFKQEISLKNQEMYCTRLKKRPPLMMSLALQMKFKAAICRRDYVLIYIILLRAVGIQCRMVQSIACDPRNCPKSELLSLSKKAEAPKSKSSAANTKSKSSTNSKSKTSKSSSFRKVNIPQLDGGDNDVPVETKKRNRALKGNATEVSNKKPESIKPVRSLRSAGTENFSPKIQITVDSPNRIPKTSTVTKKNEKMSEKAKLNRAQEMKGKTLGVFSPRKTRSMSRDTSPKPTKQQTPKLTKQPTPKTIKESPPKTNKQPTPNNKKTAVKKDTLKIVLPRSTRSRSKSTENQVPSKPNLQKLAVKRKANDADPAPTPSKTQKLSNEKSPIQKESSSRKRSSNMIEEVKKKIPRTIKVSESSNDSLKLFKQTSSSSSKSQKSLTNTSIIDRRILSSGDEMEMTFSSSKKKGIDIWVEVYSEKDERWIAIDILKCKVDCSAEIAKKATQPVVYVFAWNNDNSIKDVSARYCTKLNTVIRKMRVEREYLNSVLHLFAGIRTGRDMKEEDELNAIQMKESMPTSIAE